jgi:CubicO group peptidase (beta-lactamase class C family)
MAKTAHFLLQMLLLSGAASPALGQGSDPLIGLWGTELNFGPRLTGELVLRRQDRGSWAASLAGQKMEFSAADSDIRFNFPDGDGFRGRRVGKSIEGFWIQPTGETKDGRDPGGSGQRFATPLLLHLAGSGEWRGRVIPLDRTFTLWLSLFRGQDGALTAAFRNPQANSNGGASRFMVTRQGDALQLEFKLDSGAIVHDAQLLHSPDRIRLAWPDLNRTIELTRGDTRRATSFFPRPPDERPYGYRQPQAAGDGWRTARASATGIREEALTSIVRDIAASDPTRRPPQLIHSILVAHRGRLVLEEYFFGYGMDLPHDMRSAGKTFGSVMLGTTPSRNAGLRPESFIYKLFEARGPFANPDPRKARITLAHLMTHTSGLACDDNDEQSPGNEDRMQRQTQQPDWWRYTLDLPMAHDPGSRYAYCSANSNLVGAALTRATSTWLPDLFGKQVAEPLQFGRWHWNLMPTGEGYLGGGAFIRPRDLLKIGQAYLDGGAWNGRRIVPSEWVRRSTTPIVPITLQTTGLSAEEFGNYYGGGADALAWHQYNLKVGERSVAGYAATGNGGQILLVVPEHQLAVVFTGGNYMQGGVWTRWGQQIVGDKIIPAIVPLAH